MMRMRWGILGGLKGGRDIREGIWKGKGMLYYCCMEMGVFGIGIEGDGTRRDEDGGDDVGRTSPMKKPMRIER